MLNFCCLRNQVIRKGFCVQAALREKLGYSFEESTYILGRLNDLNNLPGNLIGAGNKKKLESHVKQKGPFKSIEDVLLVHGLGPKSMKNMCEKLLSVQGNGDTSEPSVEKIKRFRLPLMIPPLSEAQASSIKTVAPVFIGPNEISWAKINCISKNLEVWESISLDSILTSKRIDLISLIASCKDLVEKLPVCDTYVLEDLTLTSFGGNSNGSNPRSILTSIIATLIHQPPTVGGSRVVLVSGRAVAKWSGRLIGSEKVSSQSLISNIIVKLDNTSNGASMGGSNLPIIYAEPVLRSAYLRAQPITRESLADAVLLGLAFVDLALRLNPSTLQQH